MPRTTYADRFEALLAKDYIPTRDRQFIESLYTYYKSKKSLTAGRRTYFQRLEAQYAKAPVISNDMEDLITEMQALHVKAATMQDEWTLNFIDSLIQQIKTGKTLSSRQKDILKDKTEAMTDEAIDEAMNWKDTWNAEKKEKFFLCVEYYRMGGQYFQRQVARALVNADYVPTIGEYRSIVDNKYTRKILAGYYADPKYNMGDLVTKSSQAPHYGGRHIRNLTFGTIISVNHAVPLSASRGNKRYIVLDMLTGERHDCEERWLRRHKG